MKTGKATKTGKRAGPATSGKTAKGGPKPAKSVARKAAARKAAATEQPGKRQAILAAALEEFSARGFATARLDDVAKRAGVAKGTIYLYFRDKETLFQELVRAELSPVVKALEATQAAGDLPLRMVAERLITIFVRDIFATHRKDVIRLVLTEGPRFPGVAEFYFHEVAERVMTVISTLAKRAVERGELPNDALVRFPQLLGAPAIVAVIWSGLFDRWARIDVEAFMHAYMDLIFARRPA